jgi:acyl carrier protein
MSTRLEKVIREHLLDLPKDFKFERDTPTKDFCEDSLEVLDLMFAIEDEYDINIENPHHIETYGDLEDFLEVKGVL